MLHQAGTVTLDGAGYTYDNAGNRTAKTNYLNNTTENYTYDPLYQLTQVTQGTTTTESYSYDAVGNRLSSLGMSPYAYNSSNELTSTPSATFASDSNGNMLTKTDSSGTTAYNWDFENRLASVVLPGTGGTVVFKYDPFGRRIQKNSVNGTMNYLYDGLGNIIEEVDQIGVILGQYTGGVRVDEPMAQMRGGTAAYYEQDGLGSVISLTDSLGAVLNSYTYDSYGNVTASNGSFPNRFLYTGRDYDSETGLRYYRARYYDPQTGRFLSEDPLGFKAGDVNFYRYVGNSPVNFDDPSGMTKKIPDDCTELFDYIQNLYRIFDAKLEQYDAVEDGSGLIPKPLSRGGGYYDAGVHYVNLMALQTKLLGALLKWDNNCGGPGTKAPVCDRLRVQQPIPQPIGWAKPNPRDIQTPGTIAIVGAALYWIISEGSRFVFPARNLIPIP